MQLFCSYYITFTKLSQVVLPRASSARRVKLMIFCELAARKKSLISLVRSPLAGQCVKKTTFEKRCHNFKVAQLQQIISGDTLKRV
jgi:hypothetical protein